MSTHTLIAQIKYSRVSQNMSVDSGQHIWFVHEKVIDIVFVFQAVLQRKNVLIEV